MSLWLFMADAGSHLLSQNLSLCFWFKVWCSLNMTFGKCHWTLAVFCWLLFYSLVALKVYVLSPLCAGLWVSNSLFVFLSLQVMSWQKAECQHHTSTYESDSRLLLPSVLYKFLRILTLKVIVRLLAWDVIKFDSTLSLCPASDWPTTTFCLWTRSARLWQQALLTRCRHRQVIPHFILIPVDVCFSTTQGFTSLQCPSTKCVPPIRGRCDSFLNLYFFDFSPRLVWRHLCLLVATVNLKLQQTCAEQLLCREYNRRTSGLSV